MYIPFDALGPGQVGRAVYQVIGKKGPIFNPSNITYLPLPDSTPALPASVGQYGAAIAGLNLLVSTATLAMSVATYQEVRRIHAKLNQVVNKLETVDKKVDEIIARVKRIDSRVAESHLREAMKYHFGKSLASHSIDLSVLTPLVGDIDSVLESIGDEGDHVGSYSLRLSSDVREKMESLVDLLTSLRLMVAREYNKNVDGDAMSVITVDPTREYLGLNSSDMTLSILKSDLILRDWIESEGEILGLVDARFSFSDEEDKDAFEQVFQESLTSTVATLFSDAIVKSIWENLPEGILVPDDLDQSASALEAYIDHWLWKSDAGMLHRLRLELIGVRDGYQNVFWPISSRAHPEGHSPEQDSFSVLVELEVPV